MNKFNRCFVEGIEEVQPLEDVIITDNNKKEKNYGNWYSKMV